MSYCTVFLIQTNTNLQNLIQTYLIFFITASNVELLDSMQTRIASSEASIAVLDMKVTGNAPQGTYTLMLYFKLQ